MGSGGRQLEVREGGPIGTREHDVDKWVQVTNGIASQPQNLQVASAT